MITTTVLILPGFKNSGANHWQTLWENFSQDKLIFYFPHKIINFYRVQQSDWLNPNADEWVNNLNIAINKFKALNHEIVLVGHSLGSLTIALWAKQYQHQAKIKGALLVAPPQPSGKFFPTQASGFSDIPNIKFNFESIIVASSDDIYASLTHSQELSNNFSSKFINLGNYAHINGESNLGEWQQGLGYLKTFL